MNSLKMSQVLVDCVGLMTANGPAVEGVSVTRGSIRSRSCYFSRNDVTVQGGYGACFCHPGTKFNGHYELRGTKFKADRNRVMLHEVKTEPVCDRGRVHYQSVWAVVSRQKP